MRRASLVESRGFKSFKSDKVHEAYKDKVYTPRVGTALKMLETAVVNEKSKASLKRSSK